MLKKIIKEAPWQDWVFFLGGVVFDFTLWMTLINPHARVPIITSYPTGAILYLFAWTQWTMKLKITAIFTAVTATEWIVIGFLRHPL